MKRILIFVLAVVLAAVAGCTSPKLTKLEAAVDAVVSKHDTAYWVDVDANYKRFRDIDAVSIQLAQVPRPFSNDTLLKELDGFCARFFSRVENFDDLVFYRDDKRFGEGGDIVGCDSLQFRKYHFKCAFNSFIVMLSNAPKFERFRVVSGRVKSVAASSSTEPLSVFVAKDSLGVINAVMPFMQIELEDAKFEKL